MKKSVYCSCTLSLVALLLLPLPIGAVCKAGFEPRLATDTDDVCVSPPTRVRTASENARAPLLWASGPFGSKTCFSGYVWREAFVGDFACVSPAIRSQTQQDNADAASRRE